MIKSIKHVCILFLTALVLNSGCSDKQAPTEPDKFQNPGALTLKTSSSLKSVTIHQVTHTRGCSPNESLSLNASGKKIAFKSNCDLVGQNPDFSSEIFFLDIDDGDLVQLTDITGTAALTDNPFLDASGHQLAFISFADLVPGENPDANSEIFVMNTDGTGLRQLTHTIGGNDVGGGFLASSNPSLDPSGHRVAFNSPIDNLLPGGNPDGRNEIYMVNTDGSGLTQITDSQFDSYWPDFHASAQKVLFVSNRSGPLEIFSIGVDGRGLTQLTIIASNDINGYSANSSCKKIAFAVQEDLIPGGNLDGNFEIFLMDVQSGEIAQMTFTTDGRGCYGPSMSASGKSIAFASDRDLVAGSNSDENVEIFIADVKY